MLKLTSIGEEVVYHIKTYDIDHRKQVTPTALLTMMHDAAMQNVIRLGISVWDLEPQQLAWVLTNFYIDFERYPIMGEEIQIRTQPSGFERVFTYRDYEAIDSQGELIFSAASAWLLMNTQTRRMSRIPTFIRHFENDIPSPENCLERARLNIPNLVQADVEQGFRVHWHDLDFNGHANNVNYVRWMLETVEHQLMTHQLKRLEIQFKSEGKWKDELRGEAQKLNDDTYLHRLCRGEQTLAIAKTIWE
ncbi:MAG: acyl-ACP thioesterase domain-containing protein [Bacteroidota bacterium]